MDCDSCGRHRPSEQIVALRSPGGAVVMVCGRCRRHAARRLQLSAGNRPGGEGAHVPPEPSIG